ncbi:hypothetical protein DFH94DRAFT_617207, partial [Russula ochroleuca]
IVWNVDRTELLLDWLEENPEERQKLFSDSSKDAKDKGRCKHVAKGSKSKFHRMITAAVFSVDSDADICADFQVNPTNYTKSVDNYIIRLRKEYRKFNIKLGQSGAGLRYKDMHEGNKNLVGEHMTPDFIVSLEKLWADFPYWKRLHGFWHTLPNFNHHTALSEPGQDLAGEARALI